MKKPTTKFIETVCTLVANLDEQTFTAMLGKSHLGYNYFFKKWFSKTVYKRDFPGVYANMDHKHNEMVAHYLKQNHLTDFAPWTTEDIADLMRCWFIFTLNFDSRFWNVCFGDEKDKYIKMCGRPTRGFISYISATQICKAYLKFPEDVKQKVVNHAFEEYQKFEDEIEKSRKWRGFVLKANKNVEHLQPSI